VSKAVRFSVKEVGTGQCKMLGLVLIWTANLIDIVSAISKMELKSLEMERILTNTVIIFRQL